mmetsp:Transcript_27479/g.45440  ORF Transcript_27479/g.45440 Transcript_27479/m.45440 type:complete len:160 (-) Transcript_27479:57-536(-)
MPTFLTAHTADNSHQEARSAMALLSPPRRFSVTRNRISGSFVLKKGTTDYWYVLCCYSTAAAVLRCTAQWSMLRAFVCQFRSLFLHVGVFLLFLSRSTTDSERKDTIALRFFPSKVVHVYYNHPPCLPFPSTTINTTSISTTELHSWRKSQSSFPYEQQ